MQGPHDEDKTKNSNLLNPSGEMNGKLMEHKVYLMSSTYIYNYDMFTHTLVHRMCLP